MNIDLTTLITGVLPAIVSGLASYLAARYAAKKDLQRIELQWEHEREQNLDAELSELLRDVTDFCQGALGWSDHLLSDVMAFRAKVPAELDSLLVRLYEALKCTDRLEAERVADAIIRAWQRRDR